MRPKGFFTPEGRPVSRGTMAKALRAIRTNPDADYPGWNWFPTPGHFILAEYRRGMRERRALNRKARS